MPDDPGFGNGPIWTEQIPLSAGPLSPYLIIQNLTTGDASDGILNALNGNIPFLEWLRLVRMGAVPPNWQPKGMRPPYFPPTDGPPLDKGPGWPSSKPPTDWEPGPGTKFGWQRFVFFAGALLKELQGGGSFVLLFNPCRSGTPGPVVQPDGTVIWGCPAIY